MQQRQLRPGDILDDYCPRERRLTNHVVVAMIGEDIKQTRCTTCDADHEYKHARVPRQRKKSEAAAILSPVASVAPKKVVHDPQELEGVSVPGSEHEEVVEDVVAETAQADQVESRDESIAAEQDHDHEEEQGEPSADEGPVHRPLIRAQLPRVEGQPPAPRQNPDFTIRQPGGRNNRFRPRQQRGAGGGQSFQGNRSNGNMGNTRGGPPRQHGGRPPLMSHLPKRHGSGGGGRKRSK
jgi:hypothetical protein